ncbi:hypothetical protein [Blastococcus montanus]|uniref:hypothetical protein n=1 Tax=Blastococcus montanus TaxID=3144973 RepID=UPI00320BAF99
MTTLVRALRGRVAGAVAAQATQALGGLVLQVAAARSLGASGLAGFALVYGAIVLVTAVSSGLVGDSLTVLDRQERGVRAALHVWAAALAGAMGLAGAAVCALSGLTRPGEAVLIGLAAAAFMVEDLLRRLLMAAGRFWALPAVDLVALAGALAVLVLAATRGGLVLGDFVLALLAGQLLAAGVAWWRLPALERPAGPWRRPALRAVWAFGVYRAAAQVIRPALLTLLRLLVITAAGAAAYGPIEAARVVTAPTLLVVGGLGSFLLPWFVAGRESPAAGLRSADRAASGLVMVVALLGIAAVGFLPWLAPLLTGGTFAVPATAVAGWSLYAVASALLLPYAAMAAAHHQQRRVLALRSLELLSLAAVGVLVLMVPGGAVWAPAALAIGPVLAAAAVRRSVLCPLVTRSRPRDLAPVPSA